MFQSCLSHLPSTSYPLCLGLLTVKLDNNSAYLVSMLVVRINVYKILRIVMGT